MKIAILSFTVALAALSAAPQGRAADRDETPPPRNPDAELEPGGTARRPAPPVRPILPAVERRGGDGEEDNFITQWLERVREAEPEEFARLRRLRESNPPAFREEMRRRLFQRRGPAGDGADARRGLRPPPRWERDPELERIELELLQLARQFHAARDPAAREELQGRIRDKLRETFRKREDVWVARIAAMRRDLDELEMRLDQFRKDREAAVNERLRDILRPQPNPPPGSDANEAPPP